MCPDVPMIAECLTACCMCPRYFKKPMYHSSNGHTYPLHASSDALHQDTNDCKALHVARSMPHSIAGIPICLAPGLSRRMPAISYVVKDPMSRKQNEHRRLSAYDGL